MTDREKMIELIQAAVNGCSTYWAGLIADHLIANGVTVQRWIPVTERLPDRDSIVLVFLRDKARHIGGRAGDKGVEYLRYRDPLDAPARAAHEKGGERMKCKYVGTGVFEGMCLGTKEVDFCVGNERCATFKPDTTTNADRIRAMSDEELAEVILCIKQFDPKASCDLRNTCHSCAKGWLRQPVKEET